MPESNPYLKHGKSEDNPYLGKKSDEVSIIDLLLKPIRDIGTLSATPYKLLPRELQEKLPAGTVPTGEQIQKAIPGAAGTLASFLPGGIVTQATRGLSIPAQIAAQGLAAGVAGGGTEAALRGGSVGDVAQSAGQAGLLGGALGYGGGKIAARGVAKAAEVKLPPEPGSDEELVMKVTEAIKAAKPIRKEQQKMYSVERGKRFEKASEAMKVGGIEGYRAALRELAGELPKADFEGIAHMFDQAQIDRLLNMAGRAPMQMGERVRAQTGLLKLMGIHGGGVPQKSELALMEEVYGPDLVTAALKNRPTMAKLGDYARQVIEIPRAVMTMPDIGAFGRQGIMMVSRPEYWKNVGTAFRTFGDEKAYQATINNIVERETYPLMRKAGVAITDINRKLGQHEEHLVSRIVDKIPGVRNSARAHSAFLSRVRADAFDNILMHSKAAGVEIDDHYLESLASMVNTLTGRGDLGKLGKYADALNSALFSPRLMSARLSVFNPMYYAKLHPEVRKSAIKSAAASSAIMGAVASLASVSLGKRIGTNPASADFGKIKVGNTRIDLFGGHGQYARLAYQLATGHQESSVTGKASSGSRADILENFLRNKAAPVPGFVYALLREKGPDRKPISIPKEVTERLTPMIGQDAYDAFREWGPLGFGIVPLNFVGVGTQTYGGSGQGGPFISEGNPYAQTDTTKKR